MPLPTPREGEVQNDFISRCMGNETMRAEYPDQEQRAAVCHSQWRRRPTNQEDVVSYSTQATAYSSRIETHQGRQHLVVPVVMMVEGVHNGSHGPLFHPASELGKYPAAWDGIPVVIGHPEEGGVNVSANDPRIVDSQVVGRVYNTWMDGNKLKAEAWLDLEKTERTSPEALAYIRQGRPLEVSIGVFTDEEPTSGEWNGETYTAIARNHRPDHLALLPGGRGACSWEDGCGIRANEAGEGGNVDVELMERVKELIRRGFSVRTNEEVGYQELSEKIQRALDKMDDNSTMHLLQEVFDGWFVYEVRTADPNGGVDVVLFKRKYRVNDDGSVEFDGDPVKVRRKVEYIQTDGEEPSTNDDKEVKTMGERTKDKGTPCCPEKVELLIQSENTEFTEDDREWLSELDEDKVDKLVNMAEAAEKQDEPVEDDEEDKDAAEPQMNEEQAIKVLEERLSDPVKFMELLPKEHREQMEYGMKLHREHREQLIRRITSATSVYTEDELKEKETEELEKLAEAVKPRADYSAHGAGGYPTTNEDDILLPPGVEIEQ